MSVESMDRRTALRFGFVGLAALPLMPRFALAADTDADAAAPVQALNQALLSVMRAGQRAPFAQRFDMLAPVVDRAFDLNQILRVSVGPHWSTLNPQQQAALSAAFRQYTVANFVANFDSYNGQSIRVAPGTRTLSGGDQVVTTQIVSPSGSTSTLAYVMRSTPNGWKAVDVLADGSISRVATQRSDFRSLLASGGGPALVASLQNKIASLSGGTLA